MTDPQIAVDATAMDWIDLWQPRGVESRGELPGPWEDVGFPACLAHPTPEEIRAICRNCPGYSGAGSTAGTHVGGQS
eukprot:9489684-Pyramimonas_sp.AAC.1